MQVYDPFPNKPIKYLKKFRKRFAKGSDGWRRTTALIEQRKENNTALIEQSMPKKESNPIIAAAQYMMDKCAMPLISTASLDAQ